MSKFIVKNVAAELGGQFVVLKREKQGPQGQRGFQSVYTVLDANTLERVGEFLDKTLMRAFIEQQEWDQKVKDREAKQPGGLQNVIDPGPSATPVLQDEGQDDQDDQDDEDDDTVDPNVQQPQQPPV